MESMDVYKRISDLFLKMIFPGDPLYLNKPMDIPGLGFQVEKLLSKEFFSIVLCKRLCRGTKMTLG